MNFIAAISLVLSTGLLGCATHSKVAEVPRCEDNHLVRGEFGRGVIFADSAGWFDGYAPAWEKLEAYWTPSTDDVVEAETAFRACIASQAPSLLESLGLYTRQYSGVQLGGRRRVFINLFRCAECFPQWRCDPVVVDDGGDHYLRVEYDLASHQCVRLLIHGGA